MNVSSERRYINVNDFGRWQWSTDRTASRQVLLRSASRLRGHVNEGRVPGASPLLKDVGVHEHVVQVLATIKENSKLSGRDILGCL